MILRQISVSLQFVANEGDYYVFSQGAEDGSFSGGALSNFSSFGYSPTVRTFWRRISARLGHIPMTVKCPCNAFA